MGLSLSILYPHTFGRDFYVFVSYKEYGAGNETRTRDPNLGKVQVSQEKQTLRGANLCRRGHGKSTT